MRKQFFRKRKEKERDRERAHTVWWHYVFLQAIVKAGKQVLWFMTITIAWKISTKMDNQIQLWTNYKQHSQSFFFFCTMKSLTDFENVMVRNAFLNGKIQNNFQKKATNCPHCNINGIYSKFPTQNLLQSMRYNDDSFCSLTIPFLF